MPNLSKALDISIAIAWEALYLLKPLAILSDTTARRSAVEREYVKPYWTSEKRAYFSKPLLTTERRLTRS